ncbi:GAF domain-containing sensor histidine kinase [Polaribacter sp.]|uniref:GAF domain-containing sensor histidine kinase n=1 Tax=Polaribacter sp. TaxID=1920175 RepID=UPI003F6973E7
MSDRNTLKIDKSSFNYQLRFQNLLTNVYTDYINADLSKIDDLIEQSLMQITKLVGADRSFIYAYDFKKQTCSNTYEWRTENTISSIKERQNVPLQFIPHFLNEHKQGKAFYAGDVDAIKNNDEIKEKLQQFGVKSIITIPKYHNNKLLGFVGFESFTDKHLYSKAEKQLFFVFANMLVNITQRKIQEDYIEQQKILTKKLMANLESRNEELNEYMHMISHELKNPLLNMHTLISWFISDVGVKVPQANLDNLDQVLENIQKMDRLIDGVLEYSNVDKIEVQDKVINLNTVLKNTISTIAIPSHVDLKIENTLPSLFGNSWRFDQVFKNLLNNAIQNNSKEKPVISIGCEELDRYFKFYVKDNGNGIHPNYLDQVFDIFETLDEENASSGIGLAIVKKIIAFYNGKIWIESEENIGTTVFFTILKH